MRLKFRRYLPQLGTLHDHPGGGAGSSRSLFTAQCAKSAMRSTALRRCRSFTGSEPANVLVRSREPLDLVLADFSTATRQRIDVQAYDDAPDDALRCAGDDCRHLLTGFGLVEPRCDHAGDAYSGARVRGGASTCVPASPL